MLSAEENFSFYFKDKPAPAFSLGGSTAWRRHGPSQQQSSHWDLVTAPASAEEGIKRFEPVGRG
jgi:hypothetical protein